MRNSPVQRNMKLICTVSDINLSDLPRSSTSYNATKYAVSAMYKRCKLIR